jgi:hypothetical protein
MGSVRSQSRWRRHGQRSDHRTERGGALEGRAQLQPGVGAAAVRVLADGALDGVVFGQRLKQVVRAPAAMLAALRG